MMIPREEWFADNKRVKSFYSFFVEISAFVKFFLELLIVRRIIGGFYVFKVRD